MAEERKRKPRVVLLKRWRNIICNELTDEEAGRLLLAAYDYVGNGVEPDFEDNRALKVFWEDVKDTQDYYNQ